MSRSPAVDIATYLDTNGHGTVGSTLWVNKLPDRTGLSDNLIAVFDTAGFPPTNLMGNANIAFEHPGIQIRVRNQSAQTSQSKCYAIYLLLNGRSSFTGFTDYLMMAARQFPFLMQVDDSDREHWICNFALTRRPST